VDVRVRGAGSSAVSDAQSLLLSLPRQRLRRPVRLQAGMSAETQAYVRGLVIASISLLSVSFNVAKLHQVHVFSMKRTQMLSGRG